METGQNIASPQKGMVITMKLWISREQTGQKQKRLKIAAIVLAVLLTVSAGGLASRYIYLYFFAPTQSTVTVPDNLICEKPELPSGEKLGAWEREKEAAQIDESEAAEAAGSAGLQKEAEGGSSTLTMPKAAKLELYAGKPEINREFDVRNMLPGDVETRYFCVRAYHSTDIDVFFQANIAGQTKALGEVLHIKVTQMETGEVLCDAPFSEIDGKEFAVEVAANTRGETTVYYQIDLSLDTSVGNEYQELMLKADFKWYVKDEGRLDSPQTGDAADLVLWFAAAISLLLILLLLFTRHGKEERYE